MHVYTCVYVYIHVCMYMLLDVMHIIIYTVAIIPTYFRKLQRIIHQFYSFF